ncbi:MAG: AAA family ATPase [Acidobacteria bacterium]|nr:AAA family ATPase [Acidobacteriota bacterium]
MFEAISSSDLLRAQGLASEIAADEEGKGLHVAARLLRGSLNPNSLKGNSLSVNGNGSKSGTTMLSTALSQVVEIPKLSDVMLRTRWKKELESVVKEWQYSRELEARGVSGRRKLLFYGPPGCGKSLTAKALGGELSLPTYVVRFDAVIGAYLGQTAIHLRELFHFSETTPCILIFDEIDALGKKRGNPLDVGELDRIMISLMQELEHSKVRGIIVATSNLPQHLDSALWRRFDLAVEFAKPTKTELARFAKGTARNLGIPLSRVSISRLLEHAASFSDIEKSVESEARRIILSDVESSSCRKRIRK